MGSSYSSDLRSGQPREKWAALVVARQAVGEVAEWLAGTAGDDGQFDNAAADGAVLGKLEVAQDILHDACSANLGALGLRELEAVRDHLTERLRRAELALSTARVRAAHKGQP